jgi:hypothetical protein
MRIMTGGLVDIGLRLMHPRTRWGRLAREAARLAGVAVVIFVWWLLTFNDYQHDARAYWTVDLDSLYARGLVGGENAYLYSPAFAQLMLPLTMLPWTVFAGLWAALNLGALVWMAGPAIAGLLLVVTGSPGSDEVGTGNIHLMLAAAIVLAFRWPGAWALPLLTKVTPGIGVLWLAGARRWQSLAVAIGTTLAIVAISFVIAPQLWFDWFDVLTGNVDRPVPTEIAIIPGPLWARTAAGAIVAVTGGWRGWPWSVPIAATLALPVPWSSGLTILVGVIALGRMHLERTFEGRRDA